MLLSKVIGARFIAYLRLKVTLTRVIVDTALGCSEASTGEDKKGTSEKHAEIVTDV